MKNLLKYFPIIASVAFSVLCCGGPDGVQEEEVVPEGVLRIIADRTSIAADGVDCVTFRVMFGSRDVSTDRMMKLVYNSDDKEVIMSEGANVFTTTAAGTYVFKAYLYSSGDHWSENEIIVTASEIIGAQKYHQMVIGEQFTSTGCVNCPNLSEKIKEYQEQRPGVMIPLSFHMNYNDVADPMAIQATTLFYKAYGFIGLPSFNLNMRKRTGGVSRERIAEAVEEELSLFPATCGVAIGTSYDSFSREVTITTRIISNVQVRHKYHVFLVEDDIAAYQSGAGGSYVHNNVVRKMFAQDVAGMNLNQKNPFTPGLEVTAVNKATLDPAWNVGNMRVVVAALTSNDGGKTFSCNNANSCPVGQSVDYVLEGQGGNSGTVLDLGFQRHVALWEFTGAWCANCPSGYTTINFLLYAVPEFTDNVHLMAFHSNTGGEDDLAIKETDRIMSDANVTALGFPSYLVDLAYGGSLVEDVGLEAHLNNELADVPAKCGVAVSSVLSGGSAKVNVRLKSAVSSPWRVGVYVVEDKVKYKQKDGMQNKENYTHRHVVRRIVTSSYMGERITDKYSEPGSEYEASYTVEPDPSWNLANTFIYALAIDSDGRVRNMNYCALDGGNSDYRTE